MRPPARRSQPQAIQASPTEGPGSLWRSLVRVETGGLVLTDGRRRGAIASRRLRLSALRRCVLRAETA